MSASSAASWSSPSIATVAPRSAAIARSVSAKATSGWNEPTCVPAAIAGSRTSAPSAPLVWTIAWPLYIRMLRASGSIASSGTARMISSTSSTRACASANGPRALDEPSEPRAAVGIAARDRVDRPAGPAEGQAERGADRARADDAGDRRLARSRSAGAGGRARRDGPRHRRDGDARAARGRARCPPRRSPPASRPGRALDRRPAACPRASCAGVAASAGTLARSRAVRLHPSSLASQRRWTRCHGSTPSAPAGRLRRACPTSTG